MGGVISVLRIFSKRYTMRSFVLLAIVLPLAMGQVLPIVKYMRDNLVNDGRADDLEEAPYTPISTTEDYQIRSYPSAKWVCTKAEGTDNSSSMFRRLFRYITGENEEAMQIEMTRPVSRLVDIKNESKDLQMCFYLGTSHQDSPPLPLSKEVFIEERKDLVLAVRSFSGRPSHSEWVHLLDLHKDALVADGIKITGDSTYFAGYDAPWVILNRRNEIWLSVEV